MTPTTGADPPRGSASAPSLGSFLDEVKDAAPPRATLLVIGVVALHPLFIASCAGALHDPKPKPAAALRTRRAQSTP